LKTRSHTGFNLSLFRRKSFPLIDHSIFLSRLRNGTSAAPFAVHVSATSVQPRTTQIRLAGQDPPTSVCSRKGRRRRGIFRLPSAYQRSGRPAWESAIRGTGQVVRSRSRFTSTVHPVPISIRFLTGRLPCRVSAASAGNRIFPFRRAVLVEVSTHFERKRSTVLASDHRGTPLSSSSLLHFRIKEAKASGVWARTKNPFTRVHPPRPVDI
jgi:hypothetical protein